MSEEQGVFLEVNASFEAEPWGVLTYLLPKLLHFFKGVIKHKRRNQIFS
jgi:hypothetical protein